MWRRDIVDVIVAWAIGLAALAAAALLLTSCATTASADGLDIGMAVAATADIASTEYALRTGRVREVNPIMQEPGVRIAAKVGATTLIWWTARRLKKDGHPGWAKGLKIGAIAVWGGAATWNMTQARR